MRLSQQNYYGAIGFAVFAVLGMGLTSKSHLLEPLDAITHLESVQASVHDKYMERTNTRRRKFRTSTTTSSQISYEFTVDGKKYTGGDTISGQPEKNMTVYYDRRNPKINGMDLCGRAYFNLGLFGVMILVLLACIGAVVLHHRSESAAARARAHLRSGRKVESGE